MKAVKGNKAYLVDEKSKDRYINDGFNILDDEGKVVESGKGKTISYEEYQKVVAELEELKARKAAGDELGAMSLEELKAYADENGIDIGQASTQEGILKKIKTALAE